jgi:hypothetical protein
MLSMLSSITKTILAIITIKSAILKTLPEGVSASYSIS